jgi:hypothetical protein
MHAFFTIALFTIKRKGVLLVSPAITCTQSLLEKCKKTEILLSLVVFLAKKFKNSTLAFKSHLATKIISPGSQNTSLNEQI